jgi:hypothetical protein
LQYYGGGQFNGSQACRSSLSNDAIELSLVFEGQTTSVSGAAAEA